MSGHDGSSDPRDVLRLLRRRGWILLLCVLAIPTATYFYTQRLPSIYQSSVLVQPQPTASDAVLLTVQDVAPPSLQTVAAVARVAETRRVAEEAARILHEPPDSVGGVTAVADEDVGFITLTATASAPQRAADIANAVAKALDNMRTQRAANRINAAISQLKQGVDEQPDAVQRRQLSEQLQHLRALRAAQGQNVQVIEPAKGGSLVSPNPRRNASLALIAALLLGAGLMLLIERFDRKLRRPEDLEKLAKTPLLATIPKDAFPGGEGRPENAMAFQTLRDSLTYFNVDHELSVLLVVSPLKGDGKTTVATNLARSIARSGREVILVDADLRHPQVADRMGVDGSIGLSDVLLGTPVAQALREHDELRVMPAGRAPPNPSELIGSKRMTTVLAELSAQADVIVIDTTPLLMVSDAFPLLEQVSGSVALARLNKTPAPAVRKMLQIVATAGGRVLGVVATGAARTEGYGYGYGYGYGFEPDSSIKASPVTGNGRPVVPRDVRAATPRRPLADDAPHKTVHAATPAAVMADLEPPAPEVPAPAPQAAPAPAAAHESEPPAPSPGAPAPTAARDTEVYAAAPAIGDLEPQSRVERTTPAEAPPPTPLDRWLASFAHTASRPPAAPHEPPVAAPTPPAAPHEPPVAAPTPAPAPAPPPEPEVQAPAPVAAPTAPAPPPEPEIQAPTAAPALREPEIQAPTRAPAQREPAIREPAPAPHEPVVKRRRSALERLLGR